MKAKKEKQSATFVNKLFESHSDLTFIAIGITILITISRWRLPSVPVRGAISLIEGGLILIFTVTVGLLYLRSANTQSTMKSRITQTIIPMLLFGAAFALGIQISFPARKTHEEANLFLDSQIAAVERGVDLGEKITIGELTKDEAVNEIRQSDDIVDENKELAERGLSAKVDTEKEFQDIASDLVPTIPQKYMQWNCNRYGCAMRDETYVWVLSTQNQIAGTIITFFSLLFIILTVRINPLKHKNRVQ